MFATSPAEILKLVDSIDPIRYGNTRNYGNGAVTKLSPYISRGVISTKQVAKAILAKGFKPYQVLSLLKELAWRDYFQQVWVHYNGSISEDIKHKQDSVLNFEMPENIIKGSTGIDAVDSSIKNFYNNGYMHNHMRMYVASLCCNVGKSHWLNPSKWMYYHLLDADWASNALSWQWVAGTFSNKKYYANQENINKYFHVNQTNTFLDTSYEKLAQAEVPDELATTTYFNTTTNLPNTAELHLDLSLPIYIYNFYNLDFFWEIEIKANRVLLLEPSFFREFPVSGKTIKFILDLSNNIKDLVVFVGEFNELFNKYPTANFNYKEHPSNVNYKGTVHARDWMFEEISGYFPSFFSYWKKCEKYLTQL
jgi:deoxyribodipyrimidine photo-lyase